MTYEEIKEEMGVDVSAQKLIDWYKERGTNIGLRTIHGWTDTKTEMLRALLWFYQSQQKKTRKRK